MIFRGRMLILIIENSHHPFREPLADKTPRDMTFPTECGTIVRRSVWRGSRRRSWTRPRSPTAASSPQALRRAEKNKYLKLLFFFFLIFWSFTFTYTKDFQFILCFVSLNFKTVITNATFLNSYFQFKLYLIQIRRNKSPINIY